MNQLADFVLRYPDQVIPAVALVAIVLLIPATRTDLRNTRPPALRLEPLYPRDLLDEIPDDVPIPGLGGPVRKRRIPAGQGALARHQAGPVGWLWDRSTPAHRAVGPQAVYLVRAAA